MTENITFEQLPNSVKILTEEVSEVKRLLIEIQDQGSFKNTNTWFDLPELCKYLPEKPAQPTVYGWVSKKSVPFHKRGKKLYFLKSEIDEWLKQGRKKTVSEIEAETDNYLSKHKKGLQNGK
ncbi:helix-turn-helix domain-containing protein [Aquimarina celericrescens]|uniref:Helix-turn-helix domain-containing protein n=1 Tax=Aquimarina celericrescens TaxID=1964542 RepID=A0ABW5AU37_9FLAO|nr:helix-turn-helix domain-containing protein [Aquimarina celericrescens]